MQVISDEIYHGISYIGTRGETALAHDDNAIVISSFSKYWAMTGWRLGWAILPESLASAAQNVTGNLSLCAPVPAQYAAVAAFTDGVLCRMRGRSRTPSPELAIMCSTLTADLGFSDMAPPDGAFYMYARIDEILAASRTWHRHRDRVVSVCCLRPPELPWRQVMTSTPSTGSRSVRLSLAVGADKTAEALDRILDFMR